MRMSRAPRKLAVGKRLFSVSSLLATFLLLTSLAFAAVESTSTTDAKVEEAKSSFGVELGYSVSTDFAEELSPRLYRHNLQLGLGYDIKDWFVVYGETGYFFKTLGTSISDFDEDSGISHISLGLSRTLVPSLGRFAGADHSLRLSLDSSLPLTEEDRIEGSLGSIAIAPSIGSNFFDGLFTIKNSFFYQLIFNRFDFSPVSNEPNARAAYGWSVGASVPIYGKLAIGAGFGMRKLRFVDSFESFSYKNSQSISYSFGALSAAVSHENGGYTEDDTIELLYVDKYRRLVKASLTYTF